MTPLVQSLGTAVTRLDEALAEPESSITRDAAIQRFEFSFELAWKALQHALRAEGIACASPKGCLREAYRLGWIDEAPWLAMLADRNLTSHTYDEALARQVYARLGAHAKHLHALLVHLRTAESRR